MLRIADSQMERLLVNSHSASSWCFFFAYPAKLSPAKTLAGLEIWCHHARENVVIPKSTQNGPLEGFAAIRT
jgi:hypothetical protein